MFEPENQIEKDLMKASAVAEARPAFARALMDADVFVILVPQEGMISPQPNGSTGIAAGTKLTLVTAARGEEVVIPFFTAPSRARAWFKGDHVVAPDKTRHLFARHPDVSFILNPGSDYGKEFTPVEIERMLAGKIDGEVVPPGGAKILLGNPKVRPEDLIAALAKELATVKAVQGAWLMLAKIEGQSDQSWMLGVDHNGDWPGVCAAVSRAMAEGALKGKFLDVVPLEQSSLAPTLRTGIPVIAAKRGFFSLIR